MSSQVQTAPAPLPVDAARVRPIRVVFVPSMRQVKVSLGLLAGSGILLWEPLGLSWSIASPVLVAHVLVGSLLAAGVIAPFWRLHRRRLGASSRPHMRLTGRVIEASLALLIGSGAYLILFGNPGALPGQIAAQLHLWLTLPLVALIAAHLLPSSRLVSLWRAWRARPGRPRPPA